MKLLRPKLEPVRAVLLKEDLLVPKGHYLLLSESGKLSSMDPQQFSMFYGEERQPRPSGKRTTANTGRRQTTLETLQAAGKWLTSGELAALLPPECRQRVTANLVDLRRMGLISVDKSKPKHFRYIAKSALNGGARAQA